MKDREIEQGAHNIAWSFAANTLEIPNAERLIIAFVRQAVKEAIQAEREACAGIAEEIRQETEIDPDNPEFRRGFAAGWKDGCKEVLDAIRARSDGEG